MGGVDVFKRLSSSGSSNSSSVFDRLKFGGSSLDSNKNGVCRYWKAGCCTRNDCRFLHPAAAHGITRRKSSSSSWKNPNYRKQLEDFEVKSFKRPKIATSQNPPKTPASDVIESQIKEPPKTPASDVIEREKKESAKTATDVIEGQNIEPRKQLCKYWVTENCVYGDQCKNLHSWYYGDGFTMVAKLQGHTKAVTGITLPSGSDKLYSVSKDKSMRIWDCHTGQCTQVINFDGECGSLMCEGSYMYLGLPNVVKAFKSQGEVALDGRVGGRVYAMEVWNNLFIAGTQDGNISLWNTGSFEVAATLKGHTRSVLSLVAGKEQLYSGSMDRTIKIWDLKTFECLQTLHGHSDVVTSLICWKNFLFSGSLDSQLKVWAATESGKVEVIHEHNEGHGILGFCGIIDYAEAKPILMCSCNDNSVRLYNLPSFTEMGRIYSKAEVKTLQIGIGGLFFTGDATGQLAVWKVNEKSSAVVSS